MDLSKTKLADLGTMSGIGVRSSAAAELASGKVINDRYEIIRVVGQGGMGVVYEATDRLRGTSVALKFLRPELVASDTAIQRFLNEARIATDLAHDHIVRVYDVSKYDNSYFLSMELLQGKSLRELLQETASAKQQLPIAQALSIAKDIAEGLAYAHRSTIHRDIKPENIWILPDGKAKLMDFGIARLQNQTQGLTKTAAVLGTAYYMAPEQLVGSGEIDHRADQYSLGVVLYEMLTGSLPLGRSKSVKEQRPSISPKVDQCIDTLMAGRAQDRYPDTKTALVAIKALPTGPKGHAFAKRQKLPEKRTLPDRRRWFSSLAVVVAATAIGLGTWVWKENRIRDEAQAKAAMDDLNKVQLDSDAIVKEQTRTAMAPELVNRYQILYEGSQVRDTATGLIWQRCNVGEHWNGSTCVGEYQRLYRNNLQRLVRAGWRIPSIGEFASLIYCSSGVFTERLRVGDRQGEISYKCGGDFQRPTINKSVFLSTAENDRYWSSSNTSGGAYTIYFYNGDIADSSNYGGWPVRLVRSGLSEDTAKDATLAPKVQASEGKMQQCKVEAKELRGDERKAFINSCLK